MRWVGRPRVFAPTGAGRALAVWLAVAAAGCTTTERTSPTAGPAYRGDASIAFESIDGPPPGVSQRLVKTLGEEAAGRQVAVLAPSATPQYRIRAYLAEGEGGRISWVWDVYDGERRRATRIAGEEPGSAGGWSRLDEPTLRRLARASLDQLVGYLGAAPPAVAAARPASDGVAVALSARDPRE